MTGTIGRAECTFALVFLPAAALGIGDSGFLYDRLEPHHFRPITFTLVIIAGILAMFAGVRELIP